MTIMTRRQVYFLSISGKFYVSEEYNGDKTELEAIGSADSCEKTWAEILEVFDRVTSLTEFLSAMSKVQMYYHSSIGNDLPGVRVSTYSCYADIPRKDETYGVWEGIPGVFLDG